MSVTVVDRWVGGASGFRQFAYRLAVLPDGAWRLDVAPLGAPEAAYYPATHEAGHRIALGLARLFMAERQAGAGAAAAPVRIAAAGRR